MIRLESNRLIFEPLGLHHFEEYFAIDQDPEVMKFIRGVSASREVCLEKFHRYLDYTEKYPHIGPAAVFTKAGELIGFGVLIHIELNDQQEKIEVGYRLKKSAWGQGYATEMARTLLKYGFEVLKMPEIYGTTHPDHVVSQGILKKAGLIEKGSGSYYNGCSVFGLTSKEWSEL